MQQLCELKKKKRLHIKKKNPACAAVDSKSSFLWVWISVLGLVPRVPLQPTRAERERGELPFAAWRQQREVCSSQEEDVSVWVCVAAAPAEASDVSSAATPWDETTCEQKHTEMQRWLSLISNNLCRTLHTCWCFPNTVMFLYMHKKENNSWFKIVTVKYDMTSDQLR